MADMKVSVVVGLVDRLTAPMRGLVGQFQAMGSRLANVGRQIGVIGGALAAVSFLGPMQTAAAFDAQLRDIAITSGRSGKEVESFIATTARSYEALALKVGQTSENLAKGAQVLIAAGMAEPMIQQIMPTIGRVATAANATIEDTAKTAFALANTLKIAPEQMELAMARLVTAGKLGRFEFKNMAGEFPELTNQMAKLGVTGMEAVNFLGAALQTAMLGTDSPDKAANNLKNFLTKVAAPEAIKNFKDELGVDVVKLMANATAKGINPVEAVVQKMSEKLKVPQKEIDKIMKETGHKGLKGSEAEGEVRRRIEQLISGTKIGRIFQDMQVLDFLIPMLLNKDQFKRFKEEIASAGVDVIAKDFDSRMRGLSQQMLFFGEVSKQVGRRVGLAFAENLPMANKGLTELLQWVKQTDASYPNLINNVLTITGAILAFGAALAILTPVFGALGAMMGLIFSPITLILAGLAALAYAAYWVWQNWSTVLPALQQAWASLSAAFSAAWESIKSGDALKAFGAWLEAGISNLVALIIARGPEWLRLGSELIGQFIIGLGTFAVNSATVMAQIVGEIAQAVVNNLAVVQAAGSRVIQSLWDGIQSKFAEFIAWVQTIPSRIVAAIGDIDLSGIIKWPSMPSWLGGGGGAPKGGEGGAPPASTMEGFNPTSLPSKPLPPSGGVQKAEVGGRITVAATEGSRIVNVESTNAAVPLEPNRGAMLGRA
jgi:TP901 family phage tail tape measure protein